MSLFAEPGAPRFVVNGDVLPSAMHEGIRFVTLHNDPYVEIDLRGVWEQLGNEEYEGTVILDVAYEDVVTAPALQAVAVRAAQAIQHVKDRLQRKSQEKPLALMRAQQVAVKQQLLEVAQAQAHLDQRLAALAEHSVNAKQRSSDGATEN